MKKFLLAVALFFSLPSAASADFAVGLGSVNNPVLISQGGCGQTTANACLNALLPSQTSNNGFFLQTNGTNSSWVAGNAGTVTSVGLSLPAFLTVSGSPVTGSGTLTGTLATQSANQIFGGPSTGAASAPTFRALVAADIPDLSYVTSVGLSVPSDLSVSGSPVTSSGTLAITRNTQTANLVFAGPSSGGAAIPTYRSLVAADIPNLPFSQITGTVPANQGGTGQTSYTVGDTLYASGAAALSALADVATGSVYASGGVGAIPKWTSAPSISGAGITSASIPSSALVAPPVYPLVTRSGFTTTSLTQNAYTTLASPSLVLGTSTGPSAAWDVQVSFQAAPGGTLVDLALCINGTNAGSGGAGSYDAINAAVCQGSPANALAGSSNEGLPAGTKVGVNNAFWSATYANGATVSFTCQAETNTAAITAGGFCVERAFPI